ncbi:dihydroxyacetone kinase phosphoryl donor subunit DhaM [Erwiniaceae bacterium L1_54_6]|nr:dihydroxyacetone kinase phosphoryl donor subunit DhaM [Erwiniaceae bacterium L1_54_6]
MVNIVVVSHSKKLAEGVVELASQMTQGKVKFALAAGMDDAENPIGTDPIAIMTAIEDVLEDDVLVMVDMGSAILSTDMAKELLGEEAMARVQVCAAPLVEGTVAAAVAAAAGQPIDQVITEAHQALAAKYAQLGQSDWLAGASAPVSDTRNYPLHFTWTITNPTGIHARPASVIARSLSQFDADVQLANGDRALNAKSMNNVARLAIKCGDLITLYARGPQAQQAIDAFAALAATQFGDEVQESVAPEEGEVTRPGSLSVTIRRIAREMPSLPSRVAEAKPQERARLSKAISDAQQELAALVVSTEKQLSEKEAAIFSAHQMMLEDSELFDATCEKLDQQNAPVERLWLATISQMADEYRAIEDAYLRERYVDVYDVGMRVLRLLPGHPSLALPQEDTPTLIIANYLLPSEIMALDSAWVASIYFTEIGAHSHPALLAAARGIPVYIASAQHTQTYQDGSVVTLSGASGEILPQ